MAARKGAAGLGWMVSFALAWWGLLELGRLSWLAIDWADPLGWLAATEPEVALAATARVAGLALLGWIGLSTLLYLAGRALGIGGPALDWLSIGPVRRSIDALLAGSLLMGTMSPAAAGVDPSYVPVPAGSSTAPEAGAADTGSHLEDEGQDQVVVVEPGDHLWALAESRLAEILGRRPRVEEIAPYWQKVVDLNRPRLSSGDPDLIFPGEEILLPPLEP